jgi:hypothetical protein
MKLDRKKNYIPECPSNLKTITKRIAIASVLAVTGSCTVNNYYTPLEAAKEIKKVETQKEWYHNPEDLEKRNIEIDNVILDKVMAFLRKKSPQIRHGVPFNFSFKYKGIKIEGFILLEKNPKTNRCRFTFRIWGEEGPNQYFKEFKQSDKCIEDLEL